tara:strand:+ start:68 stop:442 length:375 start_codon:yes stop_codon:yes gene_type:complete
MYKGYQEELFNSDWGVNPGFKHLADKLNDLLPFEGRCANPLSINKNLEKFRRAQNAAYDFFNNGLCNKRPLFVSIFGKDIESWNIPSYKDFQYFTKVSWAQWEDNIEKVLTPIIIDAAKEQGIK